MTYKERMQKDRTVFAALKGRDRLLFLWDYYKIPILAVVCAAALILISVVTGTGRRNVAMYAVMVNTTACGDDVDAEALNRLLADAGVDMNGKTVDITADLHLGRELDELGDAQTVQVLAALFGISGLDFFAADLPVFEKYAVQDAFADLSVLIDPEILARHSDDLCYYESQDGRMVLSGILLHSGTALHEAGYYAGDVVVGIAANAENMEEALQFLIRLL